MKNLAFYPYDDNTVFLLKWRKQLENAGLHLVNYEKISKQQLLDGEVDFVFLNWYDELYSKNVFRAIAQLAKRLLRIRLLKAHDTRIVTVIHNRVPHENKHPKLSFTLKKSLLALSDSVIILSDATKNVLKKDLSPKLYDEVCCKLNKLPLPNYENVYPDKEGNFSREAFGASSDTPIFLSLGNIRPYKNTELVLRLASGYLKMGLQGLFIIAGRPMSPEYGAKLSGIAKSLPNVIFLDHYIPNEDISSLVSLSDVMIVPMDTKSSINSSELILAFSYEKPVIAPEIGTALEYPVEYNYLYSYESSKQHYEELYKASLRALEDIQAKRIEEKGHKLYACVHEQNCDDVIFDCIKRIFDTTHHSSLI